MRHPRKWMVILSINLLMFGVTPFLNCGGGGENEPTTTSDAGTEPGKAEPQAEPTPPPVPDRPTFPEAPPSDLPKPNTPYQSPTGGAPSDAFSLLAAGFQVEPGPEEKMICFHMDAPNSEDRLINRFAPEIANNGLVKRMIVSVDTGEKKDPWDCSAEGGLDDKSTPIFVWMPGVDAFQFPEKSGVMLKAGSRLRLTLLVKNDTQQAIEASSGVKLFHIPKEGKVFSLWSNPAGEVEILAGKTERKGSSCALDKPLEMIAGIPMMGPLGTSFISEVIKADGRREELIFLDQWEPKSHWKIYAFPHQLVKGDKLLTTCSWRNTRDTNAKTGWRTTDEACDLLVYVTPPAEGKMCADENTQTYTPPAIGFQPGKCAPKDGLTSAKDAAIKATIGSLDQDKSKFTGGDWTDTNWELQEGEITFKSSLIGNFLKREYTMAAGQLRTGPKVHLDLIVQAVIEYSGQTIPYKIPISISGDFKQGAKPGEFSIDIKCGELEYSDLIYKIDGDTLLLGGLINFKTNFGALDFAIKLTFKKK